MTSGHSLPSDTSPAAARVQIALLREAGPTRRAALAGRMTNAALARARRAIDESHPHLDEDGRRVLFVAVHYGRELADRVRIDLARRRSESDRA